MDLDWDIYGLIDGNEKIYSLRNDAKIIGRVFELLVAPAVRAVAEDHDMIIVPAENQNIYPDFTIMEDLEYPNSESDGLRKGDEIISLDEKKISSKKDIEEIIENKTQKENLTSVVKRNGSDVEINLKPLEFSKIAVDVKTTYREFYSRKYTHPETGKTYQPGDTRPFTFTLGGFASFLRNPTKNIQYDYRCYENHYVIGFLYTRNPDLEGGLVQKYGEKEQIPSPYQDVEFFIQHKFKVAGISPGSGNTENIGSFKTNDIEELRKGNGPFANLGEEVFEEYWRNYGRYREEDEYTNLDEFFKWKRNQD